MTTRTTVDIGIDLGTTNSSIAVVMDGRPQVIRTLEQQELVPSCVMIDRAGSISVGTRAYRQAEVRPQSVAREFKRGMGTNQTYTLDGHAMTPEQLSAEVLKSLLGTARTVLGEEITSAVVTVPAMFTLAACDATVRAAKLAGLNQVALLQEPIAAGLAYGLRQGEPGGFWLVYDLGGGTFDVSLMTLREGHLQVVDHAGDEFLGGRNFDEALIDHVVECLRGDYAIEGAVRATGTSSRRKLFAKLKQACEDARVRLSQADKVAVEIVEAEDDDRTPIDTYVEVTRDTLETLIVPLIERTTDIALKLIADHGLDAQVVRRVVMVGGPTYTPLVRRMVSERLNVPLETQVDPMTVVAQGASIYAASVVIERQSRPQSVAGGLALELKYKPVSEDPEAPVGGRFAASVSPGTRVQIERSDGGWASGQTPVAKGTFVTRVLLKPNSASTFNLIVTDGAGRGIPVAPDQFTITHGLSVDAPPLSRSLAIVLDSATGELRSQQLIPHGTRLPASKTQRFHTTRIAGPGKPDAIKVEIVEGESSKPDRNDHVGRISLGSTELRRELPAGSEVEVTISIDTSRNLSVRAFVPYLDESFDMVVTDLTRRVPDANDLSKKLDAETERLQSIAQFERVESLHATVENLQTSVAMAKDGDNDAAFRVQRDLSKLQGDIDAAESRAELPILRAKWDSLVDETRNVVAQHGTAEMGAKLDNLVREGEAALRSGDIPRLKSALENVQSVGFSALAARPAFWVELFTGLVDRATAEGMSATARVYIREGRAALDRQDVNGLRQACVKLWNHLNPGGGIPGVGIG